MLAPLRKCSWFCLMDFLICFPKYMPYDAMKLVPFLLRGNDEIILVFYGLTIFKVQIFLPLLSKTSCFCRINFLWIFPKTWHNYINPVDSYMIMVKLLQRKPCILEGRSLHKDGFFTYGNPFLLVFFGYGYFFDTSWLAFTVELS